MNIPNESGKRKKLGRFRIHHASRRLLEGRQILRTRVSACRGLARGAHLLLDLWASSVFNGILMLLKRFGNANCFRTLECV